MLGFTNYSLNVLHSYSVMNPLEARAKSLPTDLQKQAKEEKAYQNRLSKNVRKGQEGKIKC